MTGTIDRSLLGYFAGKLTGHSDQGSFYEELRDELLKRSIHLYLPSEHTPPGQRRQHPTQTSETIFHLDHFRVGLSDFVVACLDEPSTGTGMELIVSMNGLIPTFQFHHTEKQLEVDVSRMPVGNPNALRFGPIGSIPSSTAADKVITYGTVDELITQLVSQICAVRDLLFRTRQVRQRLDRAWRELDFGEILRHAQTRRNISDAQLAVELGTSQEMVTRLKMTQTEFEQMLQPHVKDLMGRGEFGLVVMPSDHSVLRYVNPSVVQLGLLSHVLQLDLFGIVGKSVAEAFGIRSPVVATHNAPPALEGSLANLAKVAHTTNPEITEYLAHREQAAYWGTQLLRDKAAARWSGPKSIELWRQEIRKIEQRSGPLLWADDE